MLHEWTTALCFMLALLSVLLPLLILFGLKFGLIDTLAQRLIGDPRSREVIGVGSGYFTNEWFRLVAQRADVGFVLPNTRSISASFNSLRNTSGGEVLRGVQMLPTGSDDPLLIGALEQELVETAAVWKHDDDPNEVALVPVILSHVTAKKLNAQIGDELIGVIKRIRNDAPEHARASLVVHAIAPESASPSTTVFVSLTFLEATEDYRDGFAVDAFQWPGLVKPQQERIYPRFRLYATSIYEVSSLRDDLMAEGLEIRTRAAEIESLQTLDRNLTLVFLLLAGIGVTGFVFSLAANLVANVERKRRDLSLIRLVGMPRSALALFPISQATCIALAGALTSFGLFALVAAVLNGFFADSLRDGESICRLLPEHFVYALAGTLFTAIVASSWAAVLSARVDPSEGLRDA